MGPESAKSGAAAEPYGREYYERHCSGCEDNPYCKDSTQWATFFGNVADELVRSLRPRTVFDAGCAIGFLVEALWDRGVEAHGRDISEFAISEVRPDVRPFCTVGSLTEPIDGPFDLVICIEVLEHIANTEACLAIDRMTSVAERLLFSSTSSDFDEPTHINVRPTIHWVREFAARGFRPVLGFDATFVCPWAILFERTDRPITEDEILGVVALVDCRVRLHHLNVRLTRLEEAEDSVGRLQSMLLNAESTLQGERLALEQERERAEHERIRAERAEAVTKAIEQSPYWRVSAPIRRRMSRVPMGIRRRARTGMKLAVTVSGIRRSTAGRRAPDQNPPPTSEPIRQALDRSSLFAALRVFRSPEPQPAVNVVTDSISAGSLYGGVGTSLLLGAMVADHLGARLRVVTRTKPGDAATVSRLLRMNDIRTEVHIEMLHSLPADGHDIAATDLDVFIATSWWSTKAIVSSIGPDRCVYLLQEDERIFYPLGDEQLRCSEVLNDNRVRCVVNTRLLYRHLTAGPDPLDQLANRSIVFEPAFPTSLFFDDPGARGAGGKRTFLFYARPHNVRNLYWRGIEAIEGALSRGILTPAQWRFVLVGRDIPTSALPGSPECQIAENLEWDEYARLIRTADVGMSLIYSPHPSYPPLDLAASGAVVLTNTFGRTKLDLSTYSQNILCVATNTEDIIDGIKGAVLLSDDNERRITNYSSAGLKRSWKGTLAPVVARIADWTKAE